MSSLAEFPGRSCTETEQETRKVKFPESQWKIFQGGGSVLYMLEVRENTHQEEFLEWESLSSQRELKLRERF